MSGYIETKDIKIIDNYYIVNDDIDAVVVDENGKIFIRKW
jgi:hypothetical protein